MLPVFNMCLGSTLTSIHIRPIIAVSISFCRLDMSTLARSIEQPGQNGGSSPIPRHREVNGENRHIHYDLFNRRTAEDDRYPIPNKEIHGNLENGSFSVVEIPVDCKVHL